MLLAAVSAHGCAMRYTHGLRDDADVALAAVRQDGDGRRLAQSPPSSRRDGGTLMCA